jgi:hypothetical protein
MTMDTSDLGEYGHLAQAESVTFWLLGRGNKGKVKGALTLYLKSLETIIREEDERFEKEQEKRWREQGEAAASAPGREKSDEEREREEEERFRNRGQRHSEYSETLKSKYEAIRARALEAAFGHLTDKDWESLDKKWKRFALQ